MPGGERRSPRIAGRLVSLPRVRLLRARHPGLDDCHVVPLRIARAELASAPDPIRVRGLDRPSRAAAVHGQLLPHGDALHRLRHRDRLPLPRRGRAERGRNVRARRVRLLHRDPGRRLRLHLEERSARVAVEGNDRKRLADYGLNSERLLMRRPGGVRPDPSKFEDELGDLEQKLMLTTLEKAVAWAQANSIWPDTFGLA